MRNKAVDRLKQLYRALLVVRDLASLDNLPRVWDLSEFVAQYNATSRGLSAATSLDLGCGGEPRNPFGAKELFGVDFREDVDRNVRCADLTTEPIPFPDQSFDYITAHDFIEHVPRLVYLPQRRFPFVQLMNEIWRVLKPGGVFLSLTPAYPFSPAFRDPTHVNIISQETFPLYFDDQCRYAAIYGFIGAFKVLEQGVRPPHLVSILQRCG